MKVDEYFKEWTSQRPNLRAAIYDADIEAMAFAEAYHKEQVKLLTAPDVSNLMSKLEKIISSHIKDAFDNEMQNYEKKELQAALETIKRLVPPSYFEDIC